MNEELRSKLLESVEKEFDQYKNAMMKLTKTTYGTLPITLQHTNGYCE